MAEDRGILEAIGRILQQYGKGKKKKKAGLESKLGQPKVMSKVRTRDPYLNSMLAAAKFEGRTDEGALMELREQYPKY